MTWFSYKDESEMANHIKDQVQDKDTNNYFVRLSHRLLPSGETSETIALDNNDILVTEEFKSVFNSLPNTYKVQGFISAKSYDPDVYFRLSSIIATLYTVDVNDIFISRSANFVDVNPVNNVNILFKTTKGYSALVIDQKYLHPMHLQDLFQRDYKMFPKSHFYKMIKQDDLGNAVFDLIYVDLLHHFGYHATGVPY